MSARDDVDRVQLRHAAQAAASRLPSGAPGTQVFLEDRLEVRVEAQEAGPYEVATTRLTGAAVEGPGRVLHVSDPSLSQLASGLDATRMRLFSHLNQADAMSRVLQTPRIDHACWIAWLESHRNDELATRVVGFHQNIWVATPDGTVLEDARRTSRVEIWKRGDPGSTVDLVLEDGAPIPCSVHDCVVERAEARRDMAPIDPVVDGPPIVFSPGAAGVVAHELIGHALEGDVAHRGGRLSMLSGAVGPSSLRVLDDPTRGRARWKIDDEGAPARAVTLLEGGRVVGLLLDRRNASALAAPPTGHGRRGSFLDPILPRMGCTFIEPGPTDPTEILETTRRGIFIRRVVGAHADPWSGRATFLVTDADRIECGRRTRPLEPFCLELEVLDAIGSIDRIGNDLEFDTCIGSCVRAGQPLAVSVGAPTVRLGVITAIL